MSEFKPVLFGCQGGDLLPEEKAFFRQARPFGFILFQRNCENPRQLKRLTDSLREAVERDNAPIFIDQEGGRVARLKPPQWPALPAYRDVGALYEKDHALGRMAAHLHAVAISMMLNEVGINGNCAPILDLGLVGASSAIGDRALSDKADVVSACARISVDTYLKNGILPVIKHMPGHGRVKVDPHVELPYVDASIEVLRSHDFKPFEALRDAPVAMNCHVVFQALDQKLPVSLSAHVHKEYLRGELGFDGLLFSDDIAMGALQGSVADRAVQCLNAGADIVLYCAGNLERMEEIVQEIPCLTQEAQRRWRLAAARCEQPHRKCKLERVLERMSLCFNPVSSGVFDNDDSSSNACACFR